MSADEWVEQMRVPTKPLPVIIEAIQKQAVADYRKALAEKVRALRLERPWWNDEMTPEALHDQVLALIERGTP